MLDNYSVTGLYKMTFETWGCFISYITLSIFTLIVSVVLRKYSACHVLMANSLAGAS